MLVKLSHGVRVNLIGDPHLGKRFENGVPLNRRGEREARQFEKFRQQLAVPCDYNICVGDVFDHPQVSLSTILAAADAYIKAAIEAHDTVFIVMAGNHDRSRQLGTVGAWELFKRLVETEDNITAVDSPARFGAIATLPWEWGVSAVEQIDDFDRNSSIELVVGHWDVQSFGGSDDHLVPAQMLRDFFPNAEIVTGHWHLPGTYVVDGVPVACTGSLEPFSHAEDPNGETYVTLTLEQLAERDDLKDKAVRVLLCEGEELPVDLDCLQLTGKRLTELDGDEPTVAERLGAFDWQTILDEHLADVPDYVRSFIDERLTHN